MSNLSASKSPVLNMCRCKVTNSLTFLILFTWYLRTKQCNIVFCGSILDSLDFYGYSQVIAEMKNVTAMEFWQGRSISNLEMVYTNYIYEEMVTQFLLVKNDLYGPRSLQIIPLILCILMKKASVSFSEEKTIVPSGEHAAQGQARNLFQKTLENWFYTIPATQASGRQEITKNVEKVCSIYLMQNSLVQNVLLFA